MVSAFSSQAYSAALRPDGKIVVGGADGDGRELVLARYQPNGALDRFGFGSGGVVRGSAITGAGAVKLQPDGKIVVAGAAVSSGFHPPPQFAVARYKANGTLDPAFGTKGVAEAGLFPAGATAAALQPDGKIVAAGSVGGGPEREFAVARFLGGSPLVCRVPNLIGKTLRAAKRAIKRVHCALGRVTRAFSSKVGTGHVISQRPRPGRVLPAGAKVKLVVSKGREHR
jgi:uncharacterized delta-60 repeat protein